MKDNNSYVYKFGYIIGSVTAVCAGLCICGVIVAATIRFLTWLF